jgi:hypothetical protein
METQMRKEYGKVLRQYFSKKMKEKLPEFKEEKIKSMYLWPGERAFSQSFPDSLKCWIVLSPSPKDYDEFTVLIGWSTLGRYPEAVPVACCHHLTGRNSVRRSTSPDFLDCGP